MLSQNYNSKTPCKTPPGLLRDDHIVLWAIDAVLAAHAAVKRWWKYWRTRQVLAELNDQQLRDIGVTRTQALRESRRWWPGPHKCGSALAELDDSQLCNLSENGLRVRREARQAGNRA